MLLLMALDPAISHTMPDSTERPIAFVCRSLSPSEHNYAQLRKEALSLIFGVKKFHQYLYGHKFTLVMDHKPLTAILGAIRRAHHHLQLLDCSVGLYFFLSEYQYKIQSSQPLIIQILMCFLLAIVRLEGVKCCELI